MALCYLFLHFQQLVTGYNPVNARPNSTGILFEYYFLNSEFVHRYYFTCNLQQEDADH